MRKILLFAAMAAILTACGGENGGKNAKNKLTLDENGLKTTATLRQGMFFDIPASMRGGAETSTKEITLLIITNFDYVALINAGDYDNIPDDALYISVSLPKELFGKTLDLSKSTYEAQNRMPYSVDINFYNGGDDFGFYFEEDYMEDNNIVGGTLKTTRNGDKISISLDCVTNDGRKIKADYSAKFTDLGAVPPSSGNGTIKLNNISKNIKWGGFIRYQQDDEYGEYDFYNIYLTPEKIGMANLMGDDLPQGSVVIMVDATALGQTLNVGDEGYMLYYIIDGDDVIVPSEFSGGTVKVTRSGSANFQIAVNLTAADKNLQVSWNGTLGDLSESLLSKLDAPRHTPTFVAPSIAKLPKPW